MLTMDDILQPFGLHYGINFDSPWLQWNTPIMGVMGYAVTILGIQFLMQPFKAYDLKWVNVLHNAFLTVLSFAMTVGTLYEVYVDSAKNGFLHTFCDQDQTVVNSPVYFWAFVFYVSKYYEFVDTVILVLRKKPLLFLHVYHHFATAFVVFLLLIGKISITWILVLLNSLVHTFMYYYYTVRLLGGTVWWKKYLTAGQIVQFFLLMTAATAQCYLKWAHNMTCSGDTTIFFLSWGFVVSLVVLFVGFYKESYSDKDKGKSE